MAVKTFTTEVLTSADTNTYLANSGLVYVTSATVGTGVSSVTISNCFSSTYDNYLISITDVKMTTANGSLKCVLGSTTSGYSQNGYYTNYASSTLNGNAAPAQAHFEVAFTDANSSRGQTMQFDLLAPYLASYVRMNSSWATESYTGVFNGILANSTQYTAFTISTSGGTPTMTGGTIRVYGYRQA
jgi:hypothetical protein